MADTTYEVGLKLDTSADDAALRATTEQLQGVQQAAQQTQDSLTQQKQAHKEAGEAAKEHAGAMRQLAAEWKQFAINAVAGLAGVAELWRFLKEGFQDAVQTQRMLRSISETTQQFGGNAKEASASALEMAETLQRIGYEKTDVLRGVNDLLLVTRDSKQALEAEALAADLATKRQIPLADAQHIVTAALMGRIGALKRMGIEASTAEEALKKLKEMAGGAADRLDDAGVSLAAVKADVEELRDSIGEGATVVLPTLIKLLREAGQVFVAVALAAKQFTVGLIDVGKGIALTAKTAYEAISNPAGFATNFAKTKQAFADFGVEVKTDLAVAGAEWSQWWDDAVKIADGKRAKLQRPGVDLRPLKSNAAQIAKDDAEIAAIEAKDAEEAYQREKVDLDRRQKLFDEWQLARMRAATEAGKVSGANEKKINFDLSRDLLKGREDFNREMLALLLKREEREFKERYETAQRATRINVTELEGAKQLEEAKQKTTAQTIKELDARMKMPGISNAEAKATQQTINGLEREILASKKLVAELEHRAKVAKLTAAGDVDAIRLENAAYQQTLDEMGAASAALGAQQAADAQRTAAAVTQAQLGAADSILGSMEGAFGQSKAFALAHAIVAAFEAAAKAGAVGAAGGPWTAAAFYAEAFATVIAAAKGIEGTKPGSSGAGAGMTSTAASTTGAGVAGLGTRTPATTGSSTTIIDNSRAPSTVVNQYLLSGVQAGPAARDVVRQLRPGDRSYQRSIIDRKRTYAGTNRRLSP